MQWYRYKIIDKTNHNPLIQKNIQNIQSKQESKIGEILSKNCFNDVLYSFSYNTEFLSKQNHFTSIKMIYTWLMITGDTSFQEFIEDINKNKYVQSLMPHLKEKSIQVFFTLISKIKSKIKYITYNTLMKIGYLSCLILQDVLKIEFHNIMIETINTIQHPQQVKSFLTGFFESVKQPLEIKNDISDEEEAQLLQLNTIRYLIYIYTLLQYTTFQFTNEKFVKQLSQALTQFYNEQSSVDLNNLNIVIFIMCKLNYIDDIQKHIIGYQNKFIHHEYHKLACQKSIETMCYLIIYHQDEQTIVQFLGYMIIGNAFFSHFIEHLKKYSKQDQQKLLHINYFKYTIIIAGILKEFQYLSISEYKHQLIEIIQSVTKHYYQKYQSQIDDIINKLSFSDLIVSLIVIGLIEQAKVENPFETFIQTYFQNNYNAVNYQIILKCSCYNQYSGDLAEVLENWDNIKMLSSQKIVKYNDIENNDATTNTTNKKAMSLLFCILCRSNNIALFNDVNKFLQSLSSLNLKMLSITMYQMLRIKYFDNFNHQYQQQIMTIIKFGIQRIQQLTFDGSGYSRFLLTITQLYQNNFQNLIKKFSNKYFINIQYKDLSVKSIITQIYYIQTMYNSKIQVLQYIQLMTEINYYNVNVPNQILNLIYNQTFFNLLREFETMFQDSEYLGMLNNYINNVLQIIKLGSNPMDYIYILTLQQLNQLIELCITQKQKCVIKQNLNFTNQQLLFDQHNGKIIFDDPEHYKKQILQLRYNDHQLKQLQDFSKIVKYCLQQSFLSKNGYYFITKYIFVRIIDDCNDSLNIQFSSIYNSLLALREFDSLNNNSDLQAAQICYLLYKNPNQLLDIISLLIFNSFSNDLLHNLIITLSKISSYNNIIIKNIAYVIYQQSQQSVLSKHNSKNIIILLGQLNSITSQKPQYILQHLQQTQQKKKQNIYQQLVNISEQLINTPDLERQEALDSRLQDIQIESNTPLLLDSERNIERLNIKECKTLKSHAKVPLLISAYDQNNQPTKFIIKSKDAVFQDHCVLMMLQQHFQCYMDKLTLYKVIPLSIDSGFLELVPFSNSLDEIGDRTEQFLSDYFDNFLTESHKYNYIQSLAQYSCCSLFLQFKDRHNGNILLLQNGQLAHIDFGFFFDTAPGGRFSLETAPFKLTKSDIRLCGGLEGVYFQQFKMEFRKHLVLARVSSYELLASLELLLKKIPGVQKRQTIEAVRAKFMDDLDGVEMSQAADNLVAQSVNNVGTGMYDRFQARQNGINH